MNKSGSVTSYEPISVTNVKKSIHLSEKVLVIVEISKLSTIWNNEESYCMDKRINVMIENNTYKSGDLVEIIFLSSFIYVIVLVFPK